MFLMRLTLTLALLMTFSLTHAQERISYAYKTLSGASESLDAVITKISVDGKRPAVVILHHSGGWEAGTNKQYVELLSQNGFIAIEPILFRKPTKTTYGESLA